MSAPITLKERQALAAVAGISRRPRMDKKIEDIRLHVAEDLKIALMQLAADDDRALSDYCERVLRFHVYGHGTQGRPVQDGRIGTDRDD